MQQLQHSPRRVENSPVLEEAHELVRCSDGVEVGLFSVVEVSVGLPYPLQHGDTERQGVRGRREGEPSVHPRLPEVAVH